MRRIFRSHFGCCSPHTGTWRSTQTNKTRSPHTNREVHWLWWTDFRKLIL